MGCGTSTEAVKGREGEGGKEQKGDGARIQAKGAAPADTAINNIDDDDDNNHVDARDNADQKGKMISPLPSIDLG